MKMNKSTAIKTASHLISPVHCVAAGRNGRTWGYNYACSKKTCTIANCGSYSHARRQRAEHVKEMVTDLVNGTAPEWATMDFRW